MTHLFVELQTCDWPRNVGCEVAETAEVDVLPQPQPVSRRQPHHLTAANNDDDIGDEDILRQRPSLSGHHQQQQQQQQQHPSIARNEQPLSDQPVISLYPIPRGQTLPPPPELRISPKPVVTSRGQPKPFQTDDIAKVKLILALLLSL